MERWREGRQLARKRSQLVRELDALVDQCCQVLEVWEVNGLLAGELGRLKDLVSLVRNSYVADPKRFSSPKKGEGATALFELFLDLEELPGFLDTWEGTPLAKGTVTKVHQSAALAREELR